MSELIEKKYERREKKYRSFCEKVRLKLKKLVIFKLILIFGGAGVSALLFALRSHYLGAGVLVAVTVIYIYLNQLHDKAAYCQDLGVNLAGINEAGIRRIKGEWTSFPDKGADLAEADHLYAEDLDITGQGSVFQYISSCTTPLGRVKLKELLFTPPGAAEEIRKKQEAVLELSKRLSFRQRFQGEGMFLKDTSHEIEAILHWGEKVNEVLVQRRNRLILLLLPVITVIFCIMACFGLVSILIPVFFILLHIILLKWKSKERIATLNTAYALKHRLEPYRNMLKVIERTNFSSALLQNTKKSLYMNNTSPSKQLGKLSRICDNISNRNNMFYFLLNIITLWDYQCAIALELWKQQYGRYLIQWFDSIGALEALSSLSNLKHDNPNWAMPDVSDSEALYVNAVQVGHPLIGKGRVENDFKLGDNRRVVLVTGSNMSGKSTFLRTIGLNLVLAYAGAPVCARSFSCSAMNVCTCMRIADNLEKNISSFYAELLRIKRIVDAVKTKGRIFFLLDEIFKGTNSYDRHHAAKVLITKLADNKCIGLVSTHDLELGALEKETDGRIANYHFQEHYEQGRISFDFKLMSGVSKTRNAIYLIKALGIEL